MSQCHCKLHGHLYAPGQQVTNDCEQWWVCGRGPGPAAGASGCGGPRLTLSPAARQRLQRRPLGVQRPAMSRDLCPGGRLPHHHLRREEVHLPRRLLLRADQGRPAAGREALGEGPAPQVLTPASALPAGRPQQLLRPPGRAGPLRLHGQADVPEDGGAAGRPEEERGYPQPLPSPHPWAPGPSQPCCPPGLALRWWSSSPTAASC